MQYLDKLKKERSIDRVIFLAGMVLAFVGFLIPTVYVKQIEMPLVDNTIEVEDDLTSTDESAEENDEEAEEEDSDDDILSDSTEEDDLDFYVYDEESDTTPLYVVKETIKDFVNDKNNNIVVDKEGNPKTETVVSYSYYSQEQLEHSADVIEDEDLANIKIEDAKTKYANVFGITGILNTVPSDQSYSFDIKNGTHKWCSGIYNVRPTAYNATFLVIIWLCSIAGIILFFVTKSIIGDIVAVLIGLAFAICSAISIPLTFRVLPIVGYMTAGGYLVIAGWILGIIGSVLGAAHIKHPELVKEL